MRIELPKPLLAYFIDEAKHGSGREREIGGGNKQVDMTVLKSEVGDAPELQKMINGTVRIVFNKNYKYIGYKVFGPQPKKKK